MIMFLFVFSLTQWRGNLQIVLTILKALLKLLPNHKGIPLHLTRTKQNPRGTQCILLVSAIKRASQLDFKGVLLILNLQTGWLMLLIVHLLQDMCRPKVHLVR